MKSIHTLMRIGMLGPLLLGASAAWGLPAVREPFQVVQPDGSTLTVRLVGNARACLYLTEDGCPLTYDRQLGYVHATISADGRRISTGVMAHDAAMRPAAERRVARVATDDEITSAVPDCGYGLMASTFPSTGKVKALVILAEFSDVKFGTFNKSGYAYSDYTDSENPVHDYWNDLLNKPGFDGFGADGSCYDWFVSNSADDDGVAQFEPQFDLFGPVELPHPVAFYGEARGASVDVNAEQMIVDACTLLDDQINFSDYDTDGDGKVDNVFVFYAGLGENDGGGPETIWPHAWDLHFTEKEMELDGVIVDHYACSKEMLSKQRIPDGIGTFIHEFSHVLGLPDLYATNYAPNAFTPGEFSVLDAGPYNNDSRTPPNYSAYERWALGWQKPELIAESGEYTLENMADSRQVFMIPAESPSEYYLVENRQQAGWDAHIPGHGMLIWHVDYDRKVFEDAAVNNDPKHQHVDLIEANGRKSTKYAHGHPFPGTSGISSYDFKAWSGESCGVSFSYIGESADGVISIRAKVDGSGVVSVGTDSGDADVIYYDLQGHRLTAPVPGTVVIRRTPTTATKILY